MESRGWGPGAYWAEVASDASSYESESAVLTETSYKPSEPLPDDEYFSFRLRIYDTPMTDGVGFDAKADSISSHFITDADGDSHITISGKIIKETDESGPVHIFGVTEEEYWNYQSSVVVPEGDTTYGLVILRMGDDDPVRVHAFLDVDDTGDNDSPGNSLYEVESSELDGSGDIEYDITFIPGLKLISPEDNAGGVGDTPQFSWEDYSDDAPAGPWTYAIIFINEDPDLPEKEFGHPDLVWGLPNTSLSFDMATAPGSENVYDMLYLITCVQSGGTYASGSCTGGSPIHNATDLSDGDVWRWGVLILQCDFADYAQNVDDNGNNIDDYTDCLLPLLSQGNSGFYVMSDTRRFTTD